MFSIAKKITIGLILCSILCSSLSFGAIKDRGDRIIKEEGILTLKRNPYLFTFLNPLKDQDKVKGSQITKKILYAFLELHEGEEENFHYHDRKGTLGYVFFLRGENGQYVWKKLIWVNWSAKWKVSLN